MRLSMPGLQAIGSPLSGEVYYRRVNWWKSWSYYKVSIQTSHYHFYPFVFGSLHPSIYIGLFAPDHFGRLMADVLANPRDEKSE